MNFMYDQLPKEVSEQIGQFEKNHYPSIQCQRLRPYHSPVDNIVYTLWDIVPFNRNIVYSRDIMSYIGH